MYIYIAYYIHMNTYVYMCINILVVRHEKKKTDVYVDRFRREKTDTRPFSQRLENII